MKKPLNEISIVLQDDYMKWAKEILSKYIEENSSILNEEDNRIIGMNYINILLESITNCLHIGNNMSFFDNYYRYIANQLIEHGWPLECVVRPCQEDKFVEVIGPFIPCIQGKDDRYQVIYGIMMKNGDYSKGHPYDNYYHAFNPIINFEKSDIAHLNIEIYDKVTVWFYYGFSDDYYDYYEDGTDFVTIKPGDKRNNDE